MGQTNPDDMQRSLHNLYLDTGQDKYLVVARSVLVLLGHEHVTYPYSFHTMDAVPMKLTYIVAALMYPWDTQSFNPVHLVPLHSQLLGGHAEK